MRISLNTILITLGAILFAAAIYRAWNQPTHRTWLSRKMEMLQKAIWAEDKTQYKVISLKVRGMTCGGCESQVENALIKLQGVKEVEVDYKQGSAVVKINPKELDAQVLVDALTKAGYSAAQKIP